jgi:hypothetical protein
MCGRDAQLREGGAEVRVGVVPERLDVRVPVQRCLDEAALDSTAAAMHEPNGRQSGGGGGVDVLLDDRDDVAGGKGMEVERRLDRHSMHRRVIPACGGRR